MVLYSMLRRVIAECVSRSGNHTPTVNNMVSIYKMQATDAICKPKLLLRSREGGGNYGAGCVCGPNPAEPAGLGSLEGGLEQPSPNAACLLQPMRLLLLHGSIPALHL